MAMILNNEAVIDPNLSQDESETKLPIHHKPTSLSHPLTIVHRLFSTCRVFTLLEFCLEHLSQYYGKGHFKKELDSEDYHTLLDTTLVVLDKHHETLHVEPTSRWEKSLSIPHIIRNFIVPSFISSRHRPPNVLALGYYQSFFPSTTDSVNSIRLKFINTTFNVFKNKSWTLFHERVGDVFMIFLLKNCSIFQHQQNGNYLQLSGFEVSTVKRGLKIPIRSQHELGRRILAYEKLLECRENQSKSPSLIISTNSHASNSNPTDNTTLDGEHTSQLVDIANYQHVKPYPLQLFHTKPTLSLPAQIHHPTFIIHVPFKSNPILIPYHREIHQMITPHFKDDLLEKKRTIKRKQSQITSSSSMHLYRSNAITTTTNWSYFPPLDGDPKVSIGPFPKKVKLQEDIDLHHTPVPSKSSSPLITFAYSVLVMPSTQNLPIKAIASSSPSLTNCKIPSSNDNRKTLVFPDLQRRRMFYHRPSTASSSTSPNWILNTLPSTDQGAKMLLMHIFSIDPLPCRPLPKRIKNLRPLAKALIHNAKRLPLIYLLQSFAPIMKCDHGFELQDENHDPFLINKKATTTTSHHQQSNKEVESHDSNHGLLISHQSIISSPNPTCYQDVLLWALIDDKRSSLLRSMPIQNHRETNYPSLVYNHLPPHQLLNYHVSHAHVFQFLKHTLHLLLPRTIFGSIHNWQHFERSIQLCVNLGVYEKLSMKLILDHIKLNHIPWLYKDSSNIFGQDKKNSNAAYHLPPTDMHIRTKLMLQLCQWIFDHIIIELLRTCFYSTESTCHKNHVLYYRREIWSIIHTNSIKQLVEQGSLEKMHQAQVQGILERRQMGYSYFRFLPKKNGLRLIINLKRKRTNPLQPRYLPSINSTLRKVLLVLTFEKEENRDQLMASGVLSDDEIYQRLVEFKSQLLRNHIHYDETGIEHPYQQVKHDNHLNLDHFGSAHIDPSNWAPYSCNHQPILPPLYFVKVDFANAYDSIKQEKLFDLIQHRIFRFEQYLLVIWSQTHTDGDQCVARWKQKIFDPSRQPQFPAFCSQLSSQVRHTIFTDGVRTEVIQRSHLIQLLHEHIYFNLLRDGYNYYRQAQGISQGSTLSSLLCNFYCAHLEQTELSEFQSTSLHPSSISTTAMTTLRDCSKKYPSVQPSSQQLLLRWIDDFLFVTTSLDQAKSFVDKMLTGFDSYGCYCNPFKTMINFEYTFHGTPLPRCQIQPGQIHPHMSWCGWSFDTISLNVQRHDLANSSKIKRSVTRIFTAHPGRAMFKRIVQGIQLKAHRMLFDPYINSKQVSLLNQFHFLWMSAIKLCYLDQSLSHIQIKLARCDSSLQARNNTKRSHHSFYLKIILAMISKLKTLVLSSTTNRLISTANHHNISSRASHQLTWLGLKASYQVFLRHKQHHQSLLYNLKALMKQKSKNIAPEEVKDLALVVQYAMKRFK